MLKTNQALFMHFWTSNCVVRNQIIGYSSSTSDEFNNIPVDTSAYKTFKSVFRQSSLWHTRKCIAYKNPGGPSLNLHYNSGPCPEAKIILAQQADCRTVLIIQLIQLLPLRSHCTKSSFIQLISLSRVTQQMPRPVTTTLSDGNLCGASETRNIVCFLLFFPPLSYYLLVHSISENKRQSLRSTEPDR